MPRYNIKLICQHGEHELTVDAVDYVMAKAAAKEKLELAGHADVNFLSVDRLPEVDV